MTPEQPSVEAHLQAIRAAFKHLGWNMTPVHSLTSALERAEHVNELLDSANKTLAKRNAVYADMVLRAEETERRLQRERDAAFARTRDDELELSTLADQVVKAEAVVEAARRFTERPFGRLAQRDFYALREALTAYDQGASE